jgi:hypothetical protein
MSVTSRTEQIYNTLNLPVISSKFCTVAVFVIANVYARSMFHITFVGYVSDLHTKFYIYGFIGSLVIASKLKTRHISRDLHVVLHSTENILTEVTYFSKICHHAEVLENLSDCQLLKTESAFVYRWKHLKGRSI